MANHQDIEQLISSLREAADSISSQSLSDIQVKLRQAADAIEMLDAYIESIISG
jgi:glutamyl-tRNA reductase